MTFHNPHSSTFADLSSQFRTRGYSERHVDRAFRLLETLEYNPDNNDWDDRRRFVLFDGLSKVAFTHVIEAERARDPSRSEALDYAMIAQCAMELVCHGKTFSNDLLQEMCGEPLDHATSD